MRKATLATGPWLQCKSPASVTMQAGIEHRRCASSRYPLADLCSGPRLSPWLALRDTPAPILIVLSGDGSEHVEHHSIDGAEHAGGELIGLRGHHPRCRQVECDDSDLAGVEFASQPVCTENPIRWRFGANRVSWPGDRAPLVRSGHLRLAGQIKRAA